MNEIEKLKKENAALKHRCLLYNLGYNETLCDVCSLDCNYKKLVLNDKKEVKKNDL